MRSKQGADGTPGLADKRILFVFCSLELGGAERQGMHLARRLKYQGCDVRILSTLPGKGPVSEMCEAAGIPWRTSRFLWPCRKSSLVRDGLRFFWSLHHDKPDVVLPYTTSPNVACGLFWRWSPAQVCVWGQRNTGDLRGDRVERRAFGRVSAVICNARHEAGFLRQTFGVARTPVHVVHNGTELEACRRTRHAWREALGIGDDAVVASMLANFRFQKDHETLIEAWRRIMESLPDGGVAPHLVLAGAPQSSHDRVVSMVHALGARGATIHMTGPVDDVPGLLAASDVGVLSSRREGLPNAVVEYMAAGLPVVATDLPGTREALGDRYEEQFCAPGDDSALAAALRQMLTDSAQRSRIGGYNAQRAATEFSVSRMCGETVAILQDLLQRQVRGQS